MQTFLVMTLTFCIILLLDFIACSIFNKFFGERFHIIFWR